jgi:hypothetical protein
MQIFPLKCYQVRYGHYHSTEWVCTKVHLLCQVRQESVSYQTPGWLARHIKSNHSGLAVPHCPIIPPPAVVSGVGLPNGEMKSVINVVGRTPKVMGPQNPVSSSGDGDAGRNGYLRSRRFSVWGGNIQM